VVASDSALTGRETGAGGSLERDLSVQGNLSHEMTVHRLASGSPPFQTSAVGDHDFAAGALVHWRMDAAALEFIDALYCDPWNAMDFDVPLPDGLDLAGLQSLRPVVYAQGIGALPRCLNLVYHCAVSRASGVSDIGSGFGRSPNSLK
jgi:hypothetical protein